MKPSRDWLDVKPFRPKSEAPRPSTAAPQQRRLRITRGGHICAGRPDCGRTLFCLAVASVCWSNAIWAAAAAMLALSIRIDDSNPMKFRCLQCTNAAAVAATAAVAAAVATVQHAAARTTALSAFVEHSLPFVTLSLPFVALSLLFVDHSLLLVAHSLPFVDGVCFFNFMFLEAALPN